MALKKNRAIRPVFFRPINAALTSKSSFDFLVARRATLAIRDAP